MEHKNKSPMKWRENDATNENHCTMSQCQQWVNARETILSSKFDLSLNLNTKQIGILCDQPRMLWINCLMRCYFYVVLHILKIPLNKVFKSDSADIKSN